MNASCDVPVVLFLFNRPEKLSQVIDVLIRARPRIVFAIADGPRHSDDFEKCTAARKLVDRLEPTCRVVRRFAENNVGCDAQIVSGLNQIFEEVAEAIVLEDDIVPDVSFFSWCERMLARYRHSDQVVHVSGRNHLGRWTLPGDGHCLLHRASCWGWATWRRAWQRNVDMPGTPETLHREAAISDLQSVLLEHFLILQEAAASGTPLAWDVRWSLKNALSGGLSVVPSINLVRNLGFGPDATHTTNGDDLCAFSPVGSMMSNDPAERCLDDPKLDRWLLIFELIASYRNPHMVRLLAGSPGFNNGRLWTDNRRLRHHFTPLADPQDTLALLEHFRACGAPSAPLEDLFHALRIAALRRSRANAFIEKDTSATLSSSEATRVT